MLLRYSWVDDDDGDDVLLAVILLESGTENASTPPIAKAAAAIKEARAATVHEKDLIFVALRLTLNLFRLMVNWRRMLSFIRLSLTALIRRRSDSEKMCEHILSTVLLAF